MKRLFAGFFALVLCAATAPYAYASDAIEISAGSDRAVAAAEPDVDLSALVSAIADIQLTMTGAGGGGGPSYTPPTLNGGLCGLDDSLTGNGGAALWQNGTWIAGSGGGNSYLGSTPTLANNAVYLPASFQYSVGGTSSWALVGRFNSLRRDPGTAATTAGTITQISGVWVLTTATSTTAGFGLNETLTGTGVTGQSIVITEMKDANAAGCGSAACTGDGSATAGQTYAVSNPNAVTISSAEAIGVTPNPGFATSAFGNDKEWNANGTGEYTISANPNCNLVIIASGGQNDPTIAGNSTALTLGRLANVLDALGPNGGTVNGQALSGANKRVLLSTGRPGGIGFDQSETHTIAATVTVVHNGAGVFHSSDCNGASPTPVVAANYPSAGTNALFTKVGSAPAAGQYSVSATGVYTFNAADAGFVGLFNYCYFANPVSVTAIGDIRGWDMSSASDYVGAATATDYHMPGALYQRPWVTSWDSYATIADPAQTANAYNIPGTLVDGEHPSTLGELPMATAAAAAINSLITTPQFKVSGWNTRKVNRTNGILTTYTGTLPGVMVAQIAALHTASPSGGQFELCSHLTCAVDNGAGVLASNGVTTGPTSAATGTINYATGAYSVTFTGIPTTNDYIIAYMDPIETVSGVRIPTANLTSNEQFDYTIPNGNGTAMSAGTLSNFGASCNASGSGTSASNFVPTDWTLTGSAALNTALTGTPTLLATCGYGTDPNGKPAFFVTLYGLVPVAGAFTVASSLVSPASFINAAGATPDLVRAHLKVVVDKGPGGHLYGLATQQVKQANTVSLAGSVAHVPCPTTNCTILSGTAGDNANALVSYTDTDAGRTFDYWTLPAPANNDAGGTLSGSSMTITINITSGAPIDMKVWLESAEQEITGK